MVGPDTRALAGECEKLSFTWDRAEITSEDVRAIVTQGKLAKAFALGDALGERNLPKVLRHLDEDLGQDRSQEIGNRPCGRTG